MARELRYVIDDAISDWRDRNMDAEGLSALWDPDVVKALARHIRDKIAEEEGR